MSNKNKKKFAILVTGLNPNYLLLANKMINSLRKTNPDIEKIADIVLYTQADALRHGFTMLPNDLKMRYMTPIFVNELLETYECVARLDSDMIITGDITHIFDGAFDVAVVQNGNPREIKSQVALMGRPVTVWDIDPIDYVNCGFVVVKSKRFAKHWLSLCTEQRAHYQFYEQDFLNILCFYGDYNVRFLDREANNEYFGLVSKGYWSEVVLKDKQLILPKNSGTEQDLWPVDADKTIKCIHVAGGADPTKFNYDWLPSRFQPEVAEHLKLLTENE